jgi:hypothetical protein
MLMAVSYSDPAVLSFKLQIKDFEIVNFYCYDYKRVNTNRDRRGDLAESRDVPEEFLDPVSRLVEL